MPVLKNAKHEAFAQAMAKGMNATEAYAEAGYRPHQPSASRLLSNAMVAARIEEILGRAAERAEITQEMVLRELAKIGFSDIRKIFTDDGRLLSPQEMDDDIAGAIASIEVVTRSLPGEADDDMDAQPHGGALARRRNPQVEYVHKIKVSDKRAALVDIGKHLGMFRDERDRGAGEIHIHFDGLLKGVL